MIHIARHGETTWNREGRLMGHIPGVLTDTGITQAQELAQTLRDKSINPTRIIASDLQRAIDTAHIVHTSFPDAKISFDKNLRERYFGHLQGKMKEDIDFEDFWRQPKDAHPFSAESEDEFTKRVATFLLSVTPTVSTESVLVVAHAGTIQRIHYILDPQHFTAKKHDNGEVISFDANQLHDAALSYIHEAVI